MRKYHHSQRQGFTLIEVMVACALTAILGLVTMGILVTLTASERAYIALTNRYESLRFPAMMLIEDVRYAWSIDSCGTSNVLLWMDEVGNETVEYRYQSLGGGLYELRRTHGVGGGSSNVQTVATDLAMPRRAGNGILTSGFECTSGTSIHYVLVLQPTSANGIPIRFDGTALQR